MSPARARRPWLAPLLWTLAVLAVLAAVFGTVFFTQWLTTRDALPPEAEAAFAAARAEAGGGTPLIEIAGDGTATVHRDLLADAPADFSKLVLLVWSPSRGKVIRVDYPYWFVKLKLRWSHQLGVLMALATGDVRNLELEITLEELKRCGPRPVLDHALGSGGRVLVWIEG